MTNASSNEEHNSSSVNDCMDSTRAERYKKKEFFIS